MDCVRIPAAALRASFFMDVSSPAHYLHLNSSGNNHAEEAWAFEKGAGLVGGDEFFVDDLLDFDGIVDEENREKEEDGGHRWKEEKGREENGFNSTSKSGVSFEELADTEPVVPVGDICDLEWVSQFVDDSSLDIPCSVLAPPFRSTIFAPPKPESKLYVTTPADKPTSHCRSPSAGSIASSMSPAEASTFSSSLLKRTWACFSDNPLEVPSKARSKRTRTSASLSWSRHAHFSESLSSTSSFSSSSSSCSAASSFCSYLPVERHPGAMFESIVHRGRGRPPLHKKSTMFKAVLAEELKKPKKKKGRKPKTAGSAMSMLPPSGQEGSVGVGGICGGRVCSHCGVSKTPQWRTGPMGAKTLCNACGVRYKSGRLLPEYRPASSPTFMSHVHSNSHRKVLEMRRKNELVQQQQEELSSSDSDSSGHTCGDSSGQSCGDSSETPAVGGDGFLAPLAAPLPAQAMVF